MIKKRFIALTGRMRDSLRSLLGQMTPDGRIIVILIMLLLFGGGSVYMSVSSIYNMGKSKGQQMHIEHIERLELQQQEQTDSINHKNNFDYE